MTRQQVDGNSCVGLGAVFPISLKQATRVAKWLGCAALTAASYYILLWNSLAFSLSYGLYLRNIMDTSSKNGRGDEVYAETIFEGGMTHPMKTVIRLRRAHYWFSATLLEANSYDVLVGLKWQDDDDLVLQLDFGCDGHNTPPVEKVGPVNIRYRFGDPGDTPKPGYESFRRRDLPLEPCD
jgi:hypothetical protein